MWVWVFGRGCLSYRSCLTRVGTMLHPPSGAGCQTNFTKQKTLRLFGASCDHNYFQLCDPLIPLPSSPPRCLPPHIIIPPTPFHLLCQVQQACGFPAWSKTVFYKWTLTLTLILSNIQHCQCLCYSIFCVIRASVVLYSVLSVFVFTVPCKCYTPSYLTLLFFLSLYEYKKYFQRQCSHTT